MSQTAQLTLISSGSMPLKPLVEAALRSELKMIELSLSRTQDNLQQFEQKYQMTTADFYRCLTEDELTETLDFIEWVGEYKTHLKLKEKQQTLQEIQFAD